MEWLKSLFKTTNVMELIYNPHNNRLTIKKGMVIKNLICNYISVRFPIQNQTIFHQYTDTVVDKDRLVDPDPKWHSDGFQNKMYVYETDYRQDPQKYDDMVVNYLKNYAFKEVFDRYRDYGGNKEFTRAEIIR